MRIMYDGVNSLAHGIAADFPHAEMIGVYVDGDYAWTGDERALFPDAVQVEISTNAANRIGDVLDVERFDAAPAQAHDWILARKAAGIDRPSIYCSRAIVPAVRLETRELALNVDYDIWVASWDNTQTPPPMPGPVATYAAKQYQTTTGYDLSVVYDDGWPHRKAGLPGLPAPEALTGTPWQFLNLAWAVVPGATGYEVEVQPVRGQSVTELATALEFHGHHQTAGFPPGPCIWRVRALPDGAWPPWVQA